MTAQDSYEYSTNTGAKLSVGKSNEEETDPQGKHNPGNRCCTLRMTTEPGEGKGNSTVWLNGVRGTKNARPRQITKTTYHQADETSG